MCRKSNRRGSLALELLLTAGLLGAIIAAGMTAISWHIENSYRQLKADQQLLAIAAFRKSVEHAWDHRCSHQFQHAAWLEIESTQDGILWNLDRLRIRHFDSNWMLLDSIWERNVEGWTCLTSEAGADVNDPKLKSISYDGRIWINQRSGTYVGGEAPLYISFRFPDVGSKSAAQGFAIRALW